MSFLSGLVSSESPRKRAGSLRTPPRAGLPIQPLPSQRGGENSGLVGEMESAQEDAGAGALMTLCLSAQMPLGTLDSFSAEPGLGSGDAGLHSASLLDKSKAPNSPPLQGAPAVCLHKPGHLAAQGPISMVPFIHGKIKCIFPGLAVQGPPYTSSPFPSSLPWSSLPSA